MITTHHSLQINTDNASKTIEILTNSINHMKLLIIGELMVTKINKINIKQNTSFLVLSP